MSESPFFPCEFFAPNLVKKADIMFLVFFFLNRVDLCGFVEGNLGSTKWLLCSAGVQKDFRYAATIPWHLDSGEP